MNVRLKPVYSKPADPAIVEAFGLSSKLPIAGDGNTVAVVATSGTHLPISHRTQVGRMLSSTPQMTGDEESCGTIAVPRKWLASKTVCHVSNQ